MKYFIQRQLNEYGPYTLADLQRYVAQGNIQPNDLARSEGMTDWMPVSQVLGNIPIPVAANVPAAAYAGGGTVYGAGGTIYAGQQAVPAIASGAAPPDLHWALVLLIGFVTCGLFTWAWLIVEAVFVKKIKPQSNTLLLAWLAVACLFLNGFISGIASATNHGEASPVAVLFLLGGIVLYLVAVFQMKSDLEDHYNSVEPIGLSLSGVMVFFFNVYYFQYHYSRISEWKRTGQLRPQ